MKRPYLQFYFGDWGSNSNLRRCSWAAKGVWVAVLGLMHDSEEYGILRWTLKEIAEAVGCPQNLVNELVAKNVMKGCDSGKCEALIYRPKHAHKLGEPVTLIPAQDGPIWYSSRLVRDEYIRNRRGNAIPTN